MWCGCLWRTVRHSVIHCGPRSNPSIGTANTSVIGVCDPVDLSRLIDPNAREAVARPVAHRDVIFDGVAHATPVYERDRLPEGERDATLLAVSGWPSVRSNRNVSESLWVSRPEEIDDVDEVTDNKRCGSTETTEGY